MSHDPDAAEQPPDREFSMLQHGWDLGLPGASAQFRRDATGYRGWDSGVAQVSEMPVVMGVRVDVGALARVRHVCDPRACRHSRCCCKSYEVVVDPGEARRIVGVLPQAARYVRGLRDGKDFDDPFEQSEGSACLAAHEDGRCVFAYTTRDGLRCALHSAARDLGLPPQAVKPKACALWPLFFEESDPPLLTVQQDAMDFACNTARRSAAGLDEGVMEILEAVFGAEFGAEVAALARSTY